MSGICVKLYTRFRVTTPCIAAQTGEYSRPVRIVIGCYCQFTTKNLQEHCFIMRTDMTPAPFFFLFNSAHLTESNLMWRFLYVSLTTQLSRHRTTVFWLLQAKIQLIYRVSKTASFQFSKDEYKQISHRQIFIDLVTVMSC